MRGLITLVSDNHTDNYIKEILVFVYYGSTVNNWPKNSTFGIVRCKLPTQSIVERYSIFK